MYKISVDILTKYISENISFSYMNIIKLYVISSLLLLFGLHSVSYKKVKIEDDLECREPARLSPHLCNHMTSYIKESIGLRYLYL